MSQNVVSIQFKEKHVKMNLTILLIFRKKALTTDKACYTMTYGKRMFCMREMTDRCRLFCLHLVEGRLS